MLDIWLVMAFQFFIILLITIIPSGGLPEELGFNAFFMLIFYRQSIGFLLLGFFLTPLVIISLKKAIKTNPLCWILSIVFWVILFIGRYVPESLVFTDHFGGSFLFGRDGSIFIFVSIVIPMFSAVVLLSKLSLWLMKKQLEKKEKEDEFYKKMEEEEKAKDMKNNSEK